MGRVKTTPRRSPCSRCSLAWWARRRCGAVLAQATLVPSVEDMMDVFETLHHQAWQRAGHTGGFDGRGPVVDG